MFVRVTKSGPRRYLRLVEGYRDTEGKVKQRVVANLGRLDQIGEEEIDSLIRSLQRAVGRSEPDPETPQFERARAYGDLWALHQIWQELGLDEALRRALRSSRRAFDAEGLIRAMVFNRLAAPRSKRGVLEWLQEDVRIPGLRSEQLRHDQLLRAMDALMSHSERVEQAIAAQLKPLLDQDLSVVFWDLTTVRIHGDREVAGDLRQHGMSKDTGGISRQFALGVVQTADGLPIAHEVFEGNVAETRTLAPMLRRLLDRYPLKRVVVVADRGLLSLDNVDTLEALAEQEGLAVDYILAVPGRRYAEFTDIMAELHPQLAEASEQTGAESVTETAWQGRRLVVAHNPERAAEQTRARRRKVERLEQLGQALAERLDNQDAGRPGRGRRSTDRSAHRRFHQMVLRQQMSSIVQADLGAETFRYDIDEAAWAAAERMDGKLLLVTSLEAYEPTEITARYRALADIERGFRVLKSDIEIAPVYHRLPERIRAHALICFLALVLHRVLRQRLKASGSEHSPQHALRVLRRVQQHRVKIAGRSYEGVTRPDGEQLELFQQLGVEVPQSPA
ncbi:IS1634 family transposase [Halorhodospira neutriphila]|uniref:IS1634 family transposase n=1 Tax=Halorhodospira neutriphila TaxID=168379 RepID=A0ABS1E153_9GAMM|nr:IS1634 family transposase [Halorhodospira neutriphila]MBK1725446.1 IS1634 family transposase [Halorhodospira neutriphila]